MILTTTFHFTYKHFLKGLFFKLDPEYVHDRMTGIGSFLGSNVVTKKFTRLLFRYENAGLVQNIAGMEFKNPVGLSAGFDKDANLVRILADVGFSFMEVGSVTYMPYAGNPKPRLTRLPKSKALVVYYGLKNIGIEKILQKVGKLLPLSNRQDFKLNFSVAKTNSSATATTEGGIEDYVNCMRAIQESNLADFYTINISCPNTFGGEPFTTPAKLESLLSEVAKLHIEKPIFVKMPINLDWEDFEGLLEVIVKYKLSGVVIGNLTKDRDSELIKDELSHEVKGGISGKPTWDLSNNLISNTFKKYGAKLTIVGVGGIFSAADAYEKIKRGASLIELITGMIFEGPQLIGDINRGLVKLLKADGFNTISEAVGSYHRE